MRNAPQKPPTWFRFALWAGMAAAAGLGAALAALE